jgi:hypothetical protein
METRLTLPTDAKIEIDGEIYKYTIPSSGRFEAERPARTGGGIVYSEFIEAKVGYAIARKHQREFRRCIDSVTREPLPYGQICGKAF